jgi:hypothetical protein
MHGIYEVRARHWKHGWELHIDGVGVTQSRSLSGAEKIAREYIALSLDVDPRSCDLTIIPALGDEVIEQVDEVRRTIRRAEQAQTHATQRCRVLVRRLASEGLSRKDIAKIIGISPQRVSQLVKSIGGGITPKAPPVEPRTAPPKISPKAGAAAALGAAAAPGAADRPVRASHQPRHR